MMGDGSWMHKTSIFLFKQILIKIDNLYEFCLYIRCTHVYQQCIFVYVYISIDSVPRKDDGIYEQIK